MNSLYNISIIVPAYNSSKYLGRCIKSLLRQDLAHYEILLIDDGSTDETGKLCDHYAKSYDNVFVIHQQNKGLAMARNAGLDCARGEFVMFIDSDDYIEDNVLGQIYETCNHNNLDILGLCAYRRDINGVITQSIPSFIGSPPEKAASGHAYIFGHGVWPFGTVAFSVFSLDFINHHKLRFPDVRYAEDTPFSICTLIHAKRVMFMDTFFYNYISTPGSLTDSYSSSSCNYQLQAAGVLYRYIETLENYTEKEKHFLKQRIGKIVFGAILSGAGKRVLSKNMLREHRDLVLGSKCTRISGKVGYSFLQVRLYGLCLFFFWALYQPYQLREKSRSCRIRLFWKGKDGA